MWENFKYCFNASSVNQYSYIKNNLFKQLISFLKRNPVSHSVRHQTTDVKSKTPHLLSRARAKRPLPNYLKDTKPADDKQSQKTSPGEWLLLTVPITTFALGTWQVQRRKWKNGIIEDLEKRTAEPAIDFPDDLAELGTLEYRKVRVKGKFDHSFELYLGPRTLIEKGQAASTSGIFSVGQSRKTGGHCVITPFVLSDSGKRILINRGWVPSSMIRPGKQVQGQVEDEVEITGVVRLQEIQGTFVPKNQPHINLFHFRDIKTMGKKCNTLPVLLEATEDCTIPGGPIAGQTNVSIRNEHMSYIVTWYSLSALTALLWCKKFVFRSG